MAPSSDEKIDLDHQDLATEQGPALADLERQRKEKALVRKLDCFIAPVLMLLMLVSYLDRGNIGFAATQGMTDDLGLQGSDLNAAVSVFYVFYILAEFPTSILVKRLQFNRVIPLITFCWGIVCLCTGFVQSFGPLIVTRILLGFFEGCQFPAMTLLLCNWYKREELAVRVAYLFIASALSGAFGGLLAWAMLGMNGVRGLAGWRWLYIIEGIITVIWAILCVFLVPKDYETAYFLNEEEKNLMRIREGEMNTYSGGSGHYDRNDIREAAQDIKSWLHGFTQIAVVTILYGKSSFLVVYPSSTVVYEGAEAYLPTGFGTFLPIIIKDGFHYSTVQAQYLVIPVNLWGAVVYAVGAYLSDRYTVRFLPLVLCAPFGIAGYAVLLCDVSAAMRYFATYLVATACYICTGGNIAWLSGNCAPDGKRAASLGILLTLTNIGGVVSGQIYYANAAPAYTLGHAWSLGCLGFAWCMWWIIRFVYIRRQGAKEQLLDDGHRSRSAAVYYTDREPDFKYQI